MRGSLYPHDIYRYWPLSLLSLLQGLYSEYLLAWRWERSPRKLQGLGSRLFPGWIPLRANFAGGIPWIKHQEFWLNLSRTKCRNAYFQSLCLGEASSCCTGGFWRAVAGGAEHQEPHLTRTCRRLVFGWRVIGSQPALTTTGSNNNPSVFPHSYWCGFYLVNFLFLLSQTSNGQTTLGYVLV